MRTHKRRWSVIGALALVLSTLAIGVATAPFASADTSQNNACLGVTGTFSTFPVPITGAATANPGTTNPGSATLGVDTITLSGTSVTIGVDSTLIGAGVTTGLVSAADSLADIGSVKNDGTPDSNAGVDAVTSTVGSIKLKVTGSNTTEGSQTTQNTAPVALTFYVTADSAGGSVVVYSAISTPPSTTPDPTRTGTVLVGALLVSVPLADTVWTPSGGTVDFTETQVTPSTTTAASLTPADKSAAPLILGPKINGTINVPFNCWPGTASVDGLTYTPGASSSIASESVVAPPTAPSCASPQAASVGASQTVTVTPSCTDVNGNYTQDSTSIQLVGVNGGATSGTVVVQPDGSIDYSNTNPLSASDTVQYTATDDTALTSTIVTVNITILGNSCTVPGGFLGGASAPGPSSIPGGPFSALGTSCQLSQVLIVPVVPASLSMSETALGGPGNPDFAHVVLGGVLDNTGSCAAGPLTLDGQPHVVCGALNSVTVVNARGTDAKWDLTGQVSDFIDQTRGPSDTCSGATRNIDQTPKDNHCIPGGNLGWVPVASIADDAVPGDTAAVHAGAVIFAPGALPGTTTPQTPALFPPDLIAPRSNVNAVTVPSPGLHDGPMELCSSFVNQSGGTFVCNAGLLLAVPGSAAAGTYTATLTLTLA